MDPSKLEASSWRLRATQELMGTVAWLGMTLPYVKWLRGRDHLDPGRRYLFACNHVSLLDTILLGGVFWRIRRVPILVLGDKAVWSASWPRRVLSAPIGYLLERGRSRPALLSELEAFGSASAHFDLLVYPEGTRGDGRAVGPCRPGLYFASRAARVPIVPMFLANMQEVSTKTGRFHPIGGLRRVGVSFGQPLPVDVYSGLARDDFSELIRSEIRSLAPTPEAICCERFRLLD